MKTTPILRTLALALVLLALPLSLVVAQGPAPQSPKGAAATQIGDAWITVSYSRPILRGRQGIFGSGDTYGSKLLAGAPVWRAGADATTRIKTDVALEIGDKTIQPGEYSFMIELKESGWTAILTQQPFVGAVTSRDDVQKATAEGKTWGAYGYDTKHDVLRAAMPVQTLEGISVDQLTYSFGNVSDEGGSMNVYWDNQMGSLPFKVVK